MAELTGLEPATSAVTGQRSNQLSYNSVWKEADSRTNFPELQQNFEAAMSRRGIHHRGAENAKVRTDLSLASV